MSENDSAQEKTEEATPKRQEKAREDGQVPRSRELTTSAVLLAGTVGLWVFGGLITQTLAEVLRFNFELERADLFDPQRMFVQLGHSFWASLASLIPLFVVLGVAAAMAPIALGGWLLSAKSLAPKSSRLDPVAGLKRMFSAKSLVELFKSIGKVGFVVTAAYLTLVMFEKELLLLSQLSVEGGIAHSLYISLWAAIWISASTLAIAMIDIPFQIYDHSKKLKMSRQEVKDEMKDSEGKPEVKGRIRQLQREMANNRMMASVPEADVIITNPTHYAVALRYNPDSMETPILLAKGLDHVALRIREVAKVNNIEMVRAPVLARAIYHTTDLEREIPHGLYLAVAQVLAYVFQLRNFRKGWGDRPEYPRNLKVPKDMKFP